MSTNYIHCLRPQFTENILCYLLDGTSVNVVISVDEEERKRLVLDIEACPLQEEARLLVVNMRVCRSDYRQFLGQLWRQYYQAELPEGVDLLGILSDLEQSAQRFIIVLANFDKMAENDVDKRFNQEFYGRLNGLKNYRNVALLLITQKAFDEMLFYIDKEWQFSKLDIQEKEILPSLLYDEVRYELSRSHPDLPNVHISHIINQIAQAEGYDYALLHFLSKQINNYSASLENIRFFVKQLKRWQKSYRKQQKSLDYLSTKRIGKLQQYFSLLQLKPLFSFIFDLIRTIFLDWPIVLIGKIFKDKKDK
ncbi:MAG: hypothetical protein KAH84_09060 [Thiomargarita sp.]|nr:hypothetical protein [Thiomargarita sp.]